MKSQSDHQIVSAESSIKTIQEAINLLLNELTPSLSKKSESMARDPISRVHHCIELVKTEASLAASLIADCAPQGRPMLAQAQQTLKSLENLQLLGQAALKAN